MSRWAKQALVRTNLTSLKSTISSWCTVSSFTRSTPFVFRTWSSCGYVLRACSCATALTHWTQGAVSKRSSVHIVVGCTFRTQDHGRSLWAVSTTRARIGKVVGRSRRTVVAWWAINTSLSFCGSSFHSSVLSCSAFSL